MKLLLPSITLFAVLIGLTFSAPSLRSVKGEYKELTVVLFFASLYSNKEMTEVKWQSVIITNSTLYCLSDRWLEGIRKRISSSRCNTKILPWESLDWISVCSILGNRSNFNSSYVWVSTLTPSCPFSSQTSSRKVPSREPNLASSLKVPC